MDGKILQIELKMKGISTKIIDIFFKTYYIILIRGKWNTNGDKEHVIL